jgi:hypothetical protein
MGAADIMFVAPIKMISVLYVNEAQAVTKGLIVICMTLL